MLLQITFVRKIGISQPKIVADGADGRQYVLRAEPALRLDDPRILPTIRAIEAAGQIDTTRWTLNTGRRH